MCLRVRPSEVEVSWSRRWRSSYSNLLSRALWRGLLAFRQLQRAFGSRRPVAISPLSRCASEVCSRLDWCMTTSRFYAVARFEKWIPMNSLTICKIIVLIVLQISSSIVKYIRNAHQACLRKLFRLLTRFIRIQISIEFVFRDKIARIQWIHLLLLFI